MSLLSITADELKGGYGEPLPIRAYIGTVESYEEGPVGQGTQAKLMIGNLRTEQGETEFANNGGTYRIGGRKVFDKFWLDHPTPKSVEIGEQHLKGLAIASGLVPPPTKDAPVNLVALGYTTPSDFINAIKNHIVGKDVKFFAKRETYTKNGETRNDTTVARYMAP